MTERTKTVLNGTEMTEMEQVLMCKKQKSKSRQLWPTYGRDQKSKKKEIRRTETRKTETKKPQARMSEMISCTANH